MTATPAPNSSMKNRARSAVGLRGDSPAPLWLWGLAAIIVIPASLPIAFLFIRTVAASDAAWEALFSVRTAWLLVRSILFTVVVTASATVIGVAAAWILVRTDFPRRGLWTTLVAIPLAIPSYVLALAFLSLSGMRGLGAELTGFALPLISGAFGAWLTVTLSTYPYVFLLARSALRGIDASIEEASRGLGATPMRSFLSVTLPQLRPAIGAGSLLVALYTLSDFGAVSLMRFDVLTRAIYAQYQGRLDRTPAAVLSILLILLALVILYIDRRSRGGGTYSTRRPGRSPERMSLSSWQKLSARIFLSCLVALGTVIPVSVLTVWLVRGAIKGQSVEVPWGAILGSFTGATVAALIAMLAALPVAILVVRHPSRGAVWLHRVVYVTFSLPHIAFGLAFVSFGARYLGGLYQSFTVLVIAYAAIFLAQASGSAEVSLRQVDPQIDEAARSLGSSRSKALRDVSVPLMRRGLIAGAVLVFLTTMKELPVTLLLRPTGFDALSIRIWSTTSELFYARAGAAALLLLVVSAVPLYLLMKGDRALL